MKKFKSVLLVFLVTSIFILLFSNCSFAMDQSLNNLEFDIKINDDGDVWITEFWDADLYDTNTLFKTLPKDSKFKEISEVSVVETDSKGNTLKTYKNSNIYRYHEAKDFFHATDNDNGKFEIAWGVSANGTEHRYFKISYMIEDCINVYNDCAEFYWKIIGDDCVLKTDRISGKVTIPNEVPNYDEFRVWAHGPLNGEIRKLDSKNCFFTITDMPINTFLELRLVFPTNIVNRAEKTKNIDKLDSILAEEQENADKANRIREVSKNISNIGLSIFFVISAFMEFFYFKKLVEILKEKNSIDIFNGKFDFPYFRDIPNGSLDPSEATILVFNDITDKNMINSLFMSLAYKRFITIKPGDKKDDTEIEVNLYNSNNKIEQLTEGEKYLEEYLEKIGKHYTLKEFENYINNHAESFFHLMNKIRKSSTDNLESVYNYVNKKAKEYKDKVLMDEGLFILTLFMYISVTIFFLVFLSGFSLIILLGFIMGVTFTSFALAIYLAHFRKKINIYTETGTEERAKWRGLKKFMEDFSLIDEREIPELSLWEQYLVYATGFGIADKVLKQLKTRFPELSDSYYYDKYSCFYIANNNMFSKTMNKSISKSISTYNSQIASSSYSSGSGRGGGFSSGGGGGRWRRPVLVEDSIY